MAFLENHRNLNTKQIKDLHLGDTNILLTCLVISKTDPKFFHYQEEKRGVMNLTLRDTVRDYINCVIWGKEDKIHEFNVNILVGSIVNVENPKIASEGEGKSKQYQPKCSSTLTLSIDTKQGQITVNTSPDNDQLKSLMKHPLKSTNETLKLSDISLYDKESVGEFVDLLVAVRYNRPSRELLIPKTGVKKKCKSIIIVDQSFQGMSLNLWSEQTINRSEIWLPIETILFITDVRVGYSEYYQAIVLNETARTLFIENPSGRDADELREYLARTPLQDIEAALSDDMIDTVRINDVMTVQQIMEKAEGVIRTDGDFFTAVCYSMITKFDIDGPYDCVRRRCELCKQYIALDAPTCLNEDCYNLQYMNSQENCIKTFFNITMNISDHTGTLVNCKLYNKFAETVMGVNVHEFMHLNDDEKGLLKWSILLERCAVKLVIRKKSVCRSRTLISVVDCTLIKPTEVSKELKIY